MTPMRTKYGLAALGAVLLTGATLTEASQKGVSNHYTAVDAMTTESKTITDVLRRTAEYQLKEYGSHIPTKNWLVGTFFSGFIASYHATGDEWYLQQAMKWSEDSKWEINNRLNADDVCPGQTYLDLYFIKKDPAYYSKLNAKLAPLFDKKEIEPQELHKWDKKAHPFIGRNTWSWCDSLYMAPPVYARMGKATGDKRYFDMLHKFYWDSVDYLYDKDEHLFFRDWKYIPGGGGKKSPTGKKIFWSRGNGWVFGGLARMIEYIPKNDPMRPKYIKLFQDMAFSIAALQGEDGLWRSSINEPSWYPTKETSGSSFFVYGFAKGINEGWLPREYFVPATIKGWSGLVECVSPQGRLRYAQIVAGSPTPVRPNDTKDYAVGAFLLAGAEVMKLNIEDVVQKAESKPFQPDVVANDGAWTWYNDERAIYHNKRIFASYVKRDGKTAITTYAVEIGTAFNARTESILSSWNQKDDHNNAALLPMKDGRVLASYTGHGKHKEFFWRYLTTKRFGAPSLSEESSKVAVTTRKGMTYQNLMRLSDEDDKIYNFFRGNNFNPNFMTSMDDAKTWSDSTLLISAGENSNQRPYVKYVSNNKDRIDFLYTDGHPRNSKQNNVYHFYYTKGTFYTSNGTVIRTMVELMKGHPIKPEEGTKIFDGSTKHGRGWTVDLEYDKSGNPYGAFISSPSGDIGTDMRYWTCRLKNGAWQTEEIAYAGSNLYPKEQHYAGGIALDPYNENRVVVSADVHPGTNEPLPKRIYQLFKGEKKNGIWDWTQLTFDVKDIHVRPVLLRDRPNTLLWFTGQYKWFGDYKCKIMTSLNL